MRSYLPKKYFLLLGIVLVFAFLQGQHGIFFGTFFLFVVLAYLFRRHKTIFREHPDSTKGVIFSPINGRVASIRDHQSHPLLGDHYQEIIFVSNWGVEMGITLPVSSEVVELVRHFGKRNSRHNWRSLLDQSEGDKWDHVMLVLKTPQQELVGMKIVHAPLAGSFLTPLFPGDRGKRQVGIGHLVFGGTLLLYVPAKYKIMIAINDEVIAGTTLIGGGGE